MEIFLKRVPQQASEIFYGIQVCENAICDENPNCDISEHSFYFDKITFGKRSH